MSDWSELLGELDALAALMRVHGLICEQDVETIANAAVALREVIRERDQMQAERDDLQIVYGQSQEDWSALHESVIRERDEARAEFGRLYDAAVSADARSDRLLESLAKLPGEYQCMCGQTHVRVHNGGLLCEECRHRVFDIPTGEPA